VARKESDEEHSMKDVTEILSSIEQGDELAASQLLPAIYDELRQLAKARLAKEAPGQTLQPTALVHEAYLRLFKGNQIPSWNSRAHFFGAAAEAMRQILVNRAIKKRRVKHGGKYRRVELEDQVAVSDPDDKILALHEALEEFEKVDPAKAELVKLRHFAGMTLPEAAETLGISRATASRHFDSAKQWLFARIHIDQ
jgi:RNA polymerase sigma factor (TIGR02999 family)